MRSTNHDVRDARPSAAASGTGPMKPHNDKPVGTGRQGGQLQVTKMEAWMHAPEVLAALAAAEDIRRNQGGTWEEARQALEAVARMPQATDATRADVANRLLIAATQRFDVTDAEIDEVLRNVADDLRLLRPLSRCAAISSACTGRPVLAREWLPNIVTELESMDRGDREVVEWLKHSRQELMRANND